MDTADLNRRFAYHAPNAEKALRHSHVRDTCLGVAYVLNDALPEGREKSLAITHLEDVMMWANASIARQEV